MRKARVERLIDAAVTLHRPFGDRQEEGVFIALTVARKSAHPILLAQLRAVAQDPDDVGSRV